MNSTKKSIAAAFGVFGCTAVLLGAAPAWGAAAAPLTEVRIYEVQSGSGGTESIAAASTLTQREHRGPNIKVRVMEVGLGQNPQGYFDGAPVRGNGTAVCQVGSEVGACQGSGVVIGYVYEYDLADKQQGNFTFSNTSINVPRNTLSATLYIR